MANTRPKVQRFPTTIGQRQRVKGMARLREGFPGESERGLTVFVVMK
jgi:hypothetical protein